jgi:hypothetical protein
VTHDRGGKQLVIAFFDDRVTGESAARILERGALVRASGGTVGVLALDERGRILTAGLGSRVADDGPGVGAVLGVIAAALTAATVPPRPHLFDDIPGLSTDDIARFAVELEAGQAAVAVLDRDTAAERAVVELTRLGGKTEVHWLTDRALRRAAAEPGISGSF